MPWCPKCKCEYREGITECSDCKVSLVDELPVEEDEDLTVTYQYESAGADEASSEGQTGASDQTSAGVYQDKKAKAEDFKSSAYTFLIVGIVGIVALILIEAGVLPISLAAPGKYITYAVMGAMFLIFIVMGISSFRSSRKFEAEAKAEDDLTQSVKDWAMQNLTKEYIVSHAGRNEEEAAVDVPEEMQYFANYAVIRDAVVGQFGELEPTYLDALCEEIYGMILM